MNYVVPVALILVFIYGLIKKVNVYDSFVLGAKNLSICLCLFFRTLPQCLLW